MTVYVDELESYGWTVRGRKTESCHMFTDGIDLSELHEIGSKIGMQLRWFQNKQSAPHYDLVPSKRDAAIAAGARPVTRDGAVRIWRIRRYLVRRSRR